MSVFSLSSVSGIAARVRSLLAPRALIVHDGEKLRRLPVSGAAPRVAAAAMLLFAGYGAAQASVDAATAAPDGYWADIVRLYQAYWASGDEAALDALRDGVSTPIYKNYIDGRRTMKRRTFLSRENSA